MRSLDSDLWRTRQGTAPARQASQQSASIIPDNTDFAAIANAPLPGEGQLSFRVRRLHERRPKLGVCVTAQVCGGKA